MIFTTSENIFISFLIFVHSCLAYIIFYCEKFLFFKAVLKNIKGKDLNLYLFYRWLFGRCAKSCISFDLLKVCGWHYCPLQITFILLNTIIITLFKILLCIIYNICSIRAFYIIISLKFNV